MQFHQIRLKRKIRETEDAVTLVFEPGEHPELLTYKSGQYLTIRVRVHRAEYLRCYSLSSLPGGQELSITVKKVKKGKVSSYLVDEIREGDPVEISEPHGRFVVEPNVEIRNCYYFFAAGSGITPIFSMIQNLLEFEPKSKVHLLYGNRREEDIIFKASLDALTQKYEGQFFLEYALSRHKKGFLWTARSDWSGLKGRIDQEMIRQFLERHDALGIPSSYYLCGPGAFIQDLNQNLEKLGVHSHRIHKEYFTVPETEGNATAGTGDYPMASIEVKLEGITHQLLLNPGEKILDGLVRQNLNPPYSCSSGACASCIAKLKQGEVKMDVALGLEEDEIKAGYILTCQSRAVSESLEIDYDV